MNQIDYSQIWSTLPFPAFVIDSDDKVVQANSAAEQIVQTSQSQMMGKDIGKFFGEKSVVVETIHQAQRQKSSLTQYGIELATVERASLECNLHVNFLDFDTSQLLMIIQPTSVAQKMSQSITHRTAARSVTAMASMLAHEIRNPLAGISGAAQLLAMNANENDVELADMIGQEAKRIGTLVDRFEHFSDSRPASRNAFNIHDILDRAIRAALAGFGASAVYVKEYDPSLPEASGDADQLLQVFQNLLKNAAEAVDPARGQIKIKTSYKSGVKFAVSGDKTETLPLQIEIIDNGKGIPPNIIGEIFEPFVSSKANGSGLGLSLVSKIVTSHGGLVECSSDENGTRFTLRLPIWKSPSKEKK
jgi:two-component system nitrogen regulation sensor histidine kinase GlnL